MTKPSLIDLNDIYNDHGEIYSAIVNRIAQTLGVSECEAEVLLHSALNTSTN